MGFDLNLEVSTELKRHELRPFVVSTEWDTVESIRHKSEFGKHLYHLLPVRETKLVVKEDSPLSSRVEGLVLKGTSNLSEFQRHGIFEWYKIERRREDENWIHALHDAQRAFDETTESQMMERNIDSDGHYQYHFNII